MASKSRGDVRWTLPGKKRPFAYSTVSESRMIASLAEQGFTPAEAKKNLHYPSTTETEILDHFIEKGFGDITLTELGVR